MSETKQFHISDVLSITTGKLVSTRRMDGVYEILGWMTGEDLMTHQLIRAAEACEEPLKQAFPDLAQVEVPDWAKDEASVKSWVKGVETEHGSFRDVPKLAGGMYEVRNPIEELQAMMGPDQEIVVINPRADLN